MLVCLKPLISKDADADEKVENEQGELESDGSEVEDFQDQPWLGLTRLRALGKYFITSQAFTRYKQRLHQFLHPDHGEHE